MTYRAYIGNGQENDGCYYGFRVQGYLWGLVGNENVLSVYASLFPGCPRCNAQTYAL